MIFLKKLFSRSKKHISSDELIEVYAGVAAGVEINKKCLILSEREGNELEQSFEQLHQAVSARLNSTFLSMVRQTSREIAEDEPYNACSLDAQQSVTEAQEVAAYWLNILSSK